MGSCQTTCTPSLINDNPIFLCCSAQNNCNNVFPSLPTTTAAPAPATTTRNNHSGGHSGEHRGRASKTVSKHVNDANPGYYKQKRGTKSKVTTKATTKKQVGRFAMNLE